MGFTYGKRIPAVSGSKLLTPLFKHIFLHNTAGPDHFDSGLLLLHVSRKEKTVCLTQRRKGAKKDKKKQEKKEREIVY